LKDLKRKRPYLLPQIDEVAETPQLYGYKMASQHLVLKESIDSRFYYGIDEFFLAWVLRSYVFGNKTKKFNIKFITWTHRIIQDLISGLFRSLAYAMGNIPEEKIKEKPEEMFKQYETVKSLLAECLNIVPENTIEEKKLLENAKNPYELLNLRMKMNNNAFSSKLYGVYGTHEMFKEKFLKGEKMKTVYQKTKDFLLSVLNACIREEITIQYIVYQSLLDALYFFPKGDSGLFEILSYEIGKGEIKELKTTKRFKQKFISLKRVSKKNNKTRKTVRHRS
jgi:hypothetical protein